MFRFSATTKRKGGRVWPRPLTPLLIALATAAPLLAPAFGTLAEAAPPAPPPSISRYVLTTDPDTHLQWGCDLGKRDRGAPGAQSSLVILDFGRPAFRDGEPGSILFNNTFAGRGAILRAVEQFARGYYLCTAEDLDSHLRIAIGTSNFGPEISFDHGLGWAELATLADEGIDDAGYSSQVDAVGASDIELDWNGPAVTRAWVDGYTSVATRPYYNYGAAEGCPPYGSCGTAAHPDWTIDDVWYVNWGAPPAWPVPEIYLTDGGNARQWQQLSRYSAVEYGEPLEFHGALTQHQACRQLGCHPEEDNSPEQGWSQLQDELNSDPLTAQDTIPWSTDIAWE
ncbi:MAG: hypothetical protein NTZ05_22850 [Chloroflexi bacterium]|nr:hypothetical protein [Chloroflexota bacterium]